MPKSTNAKRTAKRKRDTHDMRWQLCVEVGKCEVCGVKKVAYRLCCHEIARGVSRLAALDKRYAILVVCAGCHEQVQNEPLVRQLARLYLSRQADLDCVKFNRLRRRGPDAITTAEVMTEVDLLLRGRT